MKQYNVYCYDPISKETNIIGLFSSSEEAEAFAEKQRDADPLYAYYVEPVGEYTW